uniref:TF-B3 domain-containing protein n=1 Tax=Kalanchoe fedtschenkoi TaxID=63787 RepID=A0A7N0ZRV2_KALFE
MNDSPRIKHEDMVMEAPHPRQIQDSCLDIDPDDQDADDDEDYDEMPISFLSTSLRPNRDSSSPTMKRRKPKPLEVKRKLFKIVKHPLGHSREIHPEGVHKLVKPKAVRIRVKKLACHSTTDTKSSVMERAEEVQANLAADQPSFLKTMQPSHCSRGFFVKLPKNFRNDYLPNHDALMTLVDEHEEHYVVTFLAERLALSGGWRGFCTTNKLLEGDILVFQLTSPSEFRVYIVRANTLTEVDGALGLLNLDTKPATSRRNASSGADIEQLKSIESFTILVNGVNIESELPTHYKAVYFELCSSQQALLHDGLLKNIGPKLASEIISETVKIADTVRACKLSTPHEDYTIWDRTLEAFEMLGMEVAFIRARLKRIASIAFDSEEARESKLFRETVREKACVDEEITSLHLKLVELRRACRRLDAGAEALRASAEKHERRFQKAVSAPWLPET